MKRTLLSIALSAALLQAVHAQDSSSDLPPTSGASVPISYVGSNARLSLGVDDELDATGEAWGRVASLLELAAHPAQPTPSTFTAEWASPEIRTPAQAAERLRSALTEHR